MRRYAHMWTEALAEHLLHLRPGWDLFTLRWEGLRALERVLCDRGDACRRLSPSQWIRAFRLLVGKQVKAAVTRY